MIGPYRIEREIGRGPMGVVFLAHDTRLNRPVALKSLPETVASDTERLARFEREAQLLARLAHPNIGAIYGVEESEGRRYLALAFIEGETLAERLRGGALSLPETVAIGLQIASGLEAAHERGIIHRDVKPGNVMVTPDDHAKIVDFGLGKEIEDPVPAAADSPETSESTITSPPLATATGMVMGTTPYLSPEQARGKRVDRRSDIWSFGCVLYQCLTGAMPFRGPTVTDIVAGILRQEPDWSALPFGTPVRLRELLRRCLIKDPRKRLRDIGEARLVLEDLATGAVDETYVGPARRDGMRPLILIALGIAAVAVIPAAWTGLNAKWRHSDGTATAIRATLPLPSDLWLVPNNSSVAISPDGKSVALEAAQWGRPTHVWIRPMGSPDFTPLAGTEGASYPFWSPDSRTIGFFADHKMKRVPAEGGPVQVLCDAVDGRGGTWGRNGLIVFAPGPVGGLYGVSAGGGTPTALTRLDGTNRLPRFLPDGNRLLYFSNRGVPDSVGIYSLDVRSRRSAFLLKGGSGGIGVAPGYLIFERDGNLLAQRMSLNSLRLEGEAVPIAEDVTFAGNRMTGPYAVSDGTLIYHQGGSSRRSQLILYDERGRALDSLGTPARYNRIRTAPDGMSVAATMENEGLRLFDLNERGGIGRQFTHVGGVFTWSPDGKEIACGSANGMMILSATSGQPVSREIRTTGFAAPTCWSPDGSYLVYNTQGSSSTGDIWIYPLNAPGTQHPFLATAAAERMGVLSPDGKWMLYGSDESGRNEVYVTTVPAGGKWQVSAQGADEGLWLQGGRAIVYRTLGGELMEVAVSFVGGQPRFGPPRTLFGGRTAGDVGGVTSDGRRLVAGIVVDAGSSSLTLVTNWRSLIEGNENGGR